MDPTASLPDLENEPRTEPISLQEIEFFDKFLTITEEDGDAADFDSQLTVFLSPEDEREAIIAGTLDAVLACTLFLGTNYEVDDILFLLNTDKKSHEQLLEDTRFSFADNREKSLENISAHIKNFVSLYCSQRNIDKSVLEESATYKEFLKALMLIIGKKFISSTEDCSRRFTGKKDPFDSNYSFYPPVCIDLSIPIGERYINVVLDLPMILIYFDTPPPPIALTFRSKSDSALQEGLYALATRMRILQISEGHIDAYSESSKGGKSICFEPSQAFTADSLRVCFGRLETNISSRDFFERKAYVYSERSKILTVEYRRRLKRVFDFISQNPLLLERFRQAQNANRQRAGIYIKPKAA